MVIYMSSNNDKLAKEESSFTIYHEALKQSINSVFSGDVVLMPADQAFDFAIKQVKGDLKFPFISLYPSPNYEISSKNSNYLSIKQGEPIFKEVPILDKSGNYVGTSNKLSKNVKNLYINIEYQIDVWAVDRHTVEEVSQELLFWLYENRELSIKYYGRDLTFTFVVGDNIVDNSDLVNYETNNKLYRMTMNVLVTGSIFRTDNYFNVLHNEINISYLTKEEE